jgi:hypothetical protein
MESAGEPTKKSVVKEDTLEHEEATAPKFEPPPAA